MLISKPPLSTRFNRHYDITLSLWTRADTPRMAVKRLLRQTLSHDEEMIEVHSLAELILSEGVRLAAGSSIKTDGEESDPWGLVGVVDIEKHRVGHLLIYQFDASCGTRGTGSDYGVGEPSITSFPRIPPLWPTSS